MNNRGCPVEPPLVEPGGAVDGVVAVEPPVALALAACPVPPESSDQYASKRLFIAKYKTNMASNAPSHIVLCLASPRRGI